jgi:hypothetical protein
MRKPIELACGALAITGGALFAFVAEHMVLDYIRCRPLFERSYSRGAIIDVIPFAATSAFLLWLGVRCIRRGSGQQINVPKIRWGRVLSGMWIIFLSLKAYFSPPRHPSDAGEAGRASAMLFLSCMFVVFGAAIAALGFTWRKNDFGEMAIDQADASQNAPR